jgi:hypothetical protein
MTRTFVFVASVLAMMVILVSVPALASISNSSSVTKTDFTSINVTRAHYPIPRFTTQSATPGSFAFVSNFEDGQLDGWTPVSGSSPSISTTTTYSGEPSLASTGSSQTPQIDTAKRGFVTGDSFLSFQVAIDAGSSGIGYFGLAIHTTPIAIVGVKDGEVVAGASLTSLQSVEAVPSGTSYPAGWVYIAANVSSTSNGWTMNVFVDGTISTAATISTPSASSYTNGIVETTSGTVSYSNIVITTYGIPVYYPGYNNMEGYGQGSGNVVQMLPAFDSLTAMMTLNSWSIPQNGILSFQINAMNYVGTSRSTCVGFYQLGVDLDEKGTIAPWYVPGVNCVAQSFPQGRSLSTPAGSQLTLSIVDDATLNVINFTIRDISVGKTFTIAIPYTGSYFFGTYTQMEFQPSANAFPISDYKLSGYLTGIQVTPVGGSPTHLPASYMIPFILDAPSSWDFTYYQTSISGYQEIA